jgi:acetylornithine/succinyldiaminopimelate/putrescine aminotransferase
LGEAFHAKLGPLVDELAIVEELRPCGLMIGLQLAIDGTPIVEQCLERGLLVNCTQQTVIRLLPAMTLGDAELDEGCDILIDVLRNYTPQE